MYSVCCSYFHKTVIQATLYRTGAIINILRFSSFVYFSFPRRPSYQVLQKISKWKQPEKEPMGNIHHRIFVGTFDASATVLEKGLHSHNTGVTVKVLDKDWGD